MTAYGKSVVRDVIEHNPASIIASYGSVSAYAKQVWGCPDKLAKLVEAHVVESIS